MGKQFDPTNSGTLSHNDRKEKDTHPDRKGKLNVGGKWFWISGWNKTGQHGEFISLAVTEMDEEWAAKENAKQAERQQQAAQAPQAQPVAPAGTDTGFDDDDIPF